MEQAIIIVASVRVFKRLQLSTAVRTCPVGGGASDVPCLAAGRWMGMHTSRVVVLKIAELMQAVVS